MSLRPLLAAAAAAALAGSLAGCGRGTHHPGLPESASPTRGAQLIGYYGCGACHVIGGVAGADGEVGPPLTNLADRRELAGKLPNTPANLVRWIMNPQRIVPGSAMPVLGIGRRGAEAIAAYLYDH